jgi:hypothetical protein
MQRTPTWSEFTKLPLPIKARRLKKTVQVKTLEGTMIGNPGDWLITGVNGEVYPCKDEVFRKSYHPTGPDKCSFCDSGELENRRCSIYEVCLFHWRSS